MSGHAIALADAALEGYQLRLHHAATASLELARFLDLIPCVSRVLCAGLTADPSHERALHLLDEPFGTDSREEFNVCRPNPSDDPSAVGPIELRPCMTVLVHPPAQVRGRSCSTCRWGVRSRRLSLRTRSPYALPAVVVRLSLPLVRSR